MKTNESSRPAGAPCPWCRYMEATVQNGIFTCPRCSYTKDVSGPHEVRVIGWTTENDRGFPEIGCVSSKIRRAIVKELREKGYVFAWLEHQSSAVPCTPVINNGYKISCGPRAWGAIMAEARGASPDDPTAYAEYTFGVFDEPVLPPSASVDAEQLVPFDIEEAKGESSPIKRRKNHENRNL